MRAKLITAAETAGVGCVVVGAFALAFGLGLVAVGAVFLVGAWVAEQ